MTADSKVRRDLETVRAEDADQRAWDDRVAAATADEGFQAWLAMMDSVEMLFIPSELPRLGSERYREDGLRTAEAKLLERFPDQAAALAVENRELFDGYVRLIGEAFVHAFGGRWVNVPDADELGTRPQVQLPFGTLYIDPWTMVTSATKRRTGDEWALVFRCAQEDYEKWKAEGGK